MPFQVAHRGRKASHKRSLSKLSHHTVSSGFVTRSRTAIGFSAKNSRRIEGNWIRSESYRSRTFPARWSFFEWQICLGFPLFPPYSRDGCERRRERLSRVRSFYSNDFPMRHRAHRRSPPTLTGPAERLTFRTLTESVCLCLWLCWSQMDIPGHSCSDPFSTWVIYTDFVQCLDAYIFGICNLPKRFVEEVSILCRSVVI